MYFFFFAFGVVAGNVRKIKQVFFLCVFLWVAYKHPSKETLVVYLIFCLKELPNPLDFLCLDAEIKLKK